MLLNQSHPFTDLILPISAAQKRMFEAIDGRRTIEEIAGVAQVGDEAYDFFAKLWSYDQVVFGSEQ